MNENTQFIFDPKTGELRDIQVSQQAIELEKSKIKREMNIQYSNEDIISSKMKIPIHEESKTKILNDKNNGNIFSKAITYIFIIILILFFLVMGIGLIITIFNTISNLF